MHLRLICAPIKFTYLAYLLTVKPGMQLSGVELAHRGPDKQRWQERYAPRAAC